MQDRNARTVANGHDSSREPARQRVPDRSGVPGRQGAGRIVHTATPVRDSVHAASPVEDALGSSRLFQLLHRLEKLLAERYAFDVFASCSVNFGLMVTYRQRWIPHSYQVGDLVSTI